MYEATVKYSVNKWKRCKLKWLYSGEHVMAVPTILQGSHMERQKFTANLSSANSIFKFSNIQTPSKSQSFLFMIYKFIIQNLLPGAKKVWTFSQKSHFDFPTIISIKAYFQCSSQKNHGLIEGITFVSSENNERSLRARKREREGIKKLKVKSLHGSTTFD